MEIDVASQMGITTITTPPICLAKDLSHRSHWFLLVLRPFKNRKVHLELTYTGVSHFQASGNHPSQEQVRSFVDSNFAAEGTEFVEWDPSDWKEDIALFDKITVWIMWHIFYGVIYHKEIGEKQMKAKNKLKTILC